MESVLRPTSLTVRYVPLYEGLATAPLRFASLWLAQKAVIRGIGAVSGPRGATAARIIFHGWFFVRGWTPGLPTSSFILPPAPRRSLLADPVDRVHAWHLSSEIPLFRRETNEKLPLSLPPLYFCSRYCQHCVLHPFPER